MKAYLKHSSGNEFEFHFELSFPNVNTKAMWACHNSKSRRKFDSKNMKNFQILEDKGDQGIITYHEKHSDLSIMKKRELVSEMWYCENAFGPGKHALWQHSTFHHSKPESD